MTIGMIPSVVPFAFTPTVGAGVVLPHFDGATWVCYAASAAPADWQTDQTGSAEEQMSYRQHRQHPRQRRMDTRHGTVPEVATVPPLQTTGERSHEPSRQQYAFLRPARRPDSNPAQSQNQHCGGGYASAVHNRWQNHYHQHPDQPPQHAPSSSNGHIAVGHRDVILEEHVSNAVCALSSPHRSLVMRQSFEISSKLPPRNGPSIQGVPWWSAAGADKLRHRLDDQGSSTVERIHVLRSIIDSAWVMAIRRHGCRVVQRAFEVAERPEQLALSGKLKTHVLESLRSPHANYVLQRCIVLLPPEHLQFVVEELRGHVGDIARHRFGCRVVERLLEHFSPEAISGLVEEVLEAHPVAELCMHEFGNYVVQGILEHGMPHHRTRVVDGLVPDVRRLAKHRVASHVVERAFMYGSPEDRQRLTDSIASNPKDLTKLSRSLYGSFVVRQLARAEGM